MENTREAALEVLPKTFKIIFVILKLQGFTQLQFLSNLIYFLSNKFQNPDLCLSGEPTGHHPVQVHFSLQIDFFDEGQKDSGEVGLHIVLAQEVWNRFYAIRNKRGIETNILHLSGSFLQSDYLNFRVIFLSTKQFVKNGLQQKYHWECTSGFEINCCDWSALSQIQYHLMCYVGLAYTCQITSFQGQTKQII